MLGLNGYYLKQTTDDKQFGRTVQFNGEDVNDGVRGQVFAIGPALHLTFLKYASARFAGPGSLMSRTVRRATCSGRRSAFRMRFE